jgi:hypothetical protein
MAAKRQGSVLEKADQQCQATCARIHRLVLGTRTEHVSGAAIGGVVGVGDDWLSNITEVNTMTQSEVSTLLTDLRSNNPDLLSRLLSNVRTAKMSAIEELRIYGGRSLSRDEALEFIEAVAWECVVPFPDEDE